MEQQIALVSREGLEQQQMAADPQHVAVLQRVVVDPASVDDRAVVAAEVADDERAVERARLNPGVRSRDLGVIEPKAALVRLGESADLDGFAREHEHVVAARIRTLQHDQTVSQATVLILAGGGLGRVAHGWVR